MSTAARVGFPNCLCTDLQVLTLLLHWSTQGLGCYFQLFVNEEVGSHQNKDCSVDKDLRLPALHKLVLDMQYLISNFPDQTQVQMGCKWGWKGNSLLKCVEINLRTKGFRMQCLLNKDAVRIIF